ncbi:hypothetical protein [Mucilaginibacter frigoritolerans]|nr:hypothetical protein [Mucilaginibacter frigoritolerans]
MAKNKIKSEKTLKEKNSTQQWVFFGINLIAFLVMVFAFSISENGKDFKEMLMNKGIWFIVSPVILFILNGLVSADQKAMLIYWKRKYSLPGCRAFTHYAKTDPRINTDRLKEMHGDLPILPEEQNSKWYAIYRTFKTDSIVDKSHQDFLLARDLCASSFLFLLILPIPVLVFSQHPLKYAYLLLLALQYLLLVITARNYGARFVCNVLSLESVK